MEGITPSPVTEEALEQGAVITSTGDRSVEIRSRLEIARLALTSLNNLWKDQALNKETKARLRALFWPVATYGCESWTMKASDKKRIAGFEMTAYRRMLRISCKDNRTNQSILDELDTTAEWHTVRTTSGWVRENGMGQNSMACICVAGFGLRPSEMRKNQSSPVHRYPHCWWTMVWYGIVEFNVPLDTV